MTDREWVPKVGDRVIVTRTEVIDAVERHDGITRCYLERSGVSWSLDDLRPADEPSVDEMLEAICPDETGEVIRVWRTEDGGVIVQRCLEDEPPHCGPTLTDAIRAAFEAVTKGE